MSADNELSAVLNRRCQINDDLDAGKQVKKVLRVFNPYTEFPEFSRKEIKEYERIFKKYDTGNDGFLDLEELKRMMEKLGAPQTHIGLKQMIREATEDDTVSMISFRAFLTVFRKAAAGELTADSGLSQLAKLTEINVDEVGVAGAKQFFQAKISELERDKNFLDEIRREEEERQRLEQQRRERKAEFKERAALFNHA